MNLGLLILRLVVGLLFVGHGAQKLFGIWGGHGLKGTAGFFEAIGLKPGHVHATAAAVMEFGGGALLALGLVTPVASLALIAVMTAAIISVHFAKGLWVTNGGYEYNLVLASVALALAATGPVPGRSITPCRSICTAFCGRRGAGRRRHRRRRRRPQRPRIWPPCGRTRDAQPDCGVTET